MYGGRCCATEPRLRTDLLLDMFIEMLLGSTVNRSARSQRRVWSPSTWSFYLAPSVDSFAIHRFGLRLSCHPREEGMLRQKERSSETKSLRRNSTVREGRSR